MYFGTKNINSLIPASITEIFTRLRQRGYNLEFRREPACIYCLELHKWIGPEKFNVDELYHFQETGFPDEDRILVAISCGNNIKGVLVDAYDVYADNLSEEMVKKFEILNEHLIIIWQK